MEDGSEVASNAGAASKWKVSAGSKVQLTIFEKLNPSENDKVDLKVKNRVTIKDLIYTVENKKDLPNRQLILHKAALMLNGINCGEL